MITLEEIITDIRNSLVVEQENDLFYCTALAGEVGEYCNFIKKENRTDGVRFKFKKDTDMENMDIIYYSIAARMVRIPNLNDLTAKEIAEIIEQDWHTKMNHNEIKYGRPVKRRPFICNCTKCEEKVCQK